MVTSYPLFAMATEIAGDAVDVRWPSRSVASPQDWIPSTGDVRLLQSADLILMSGAGYEPWTQNLSLPRSRTVDTSKPLSGVEGATVWLLRVNGEITHQHGPRGSQTTGDLISTIWLSPELAAIQLQRVNLELGRIVPAHQVEFSERAAKLGNGLDKLNARILALSSMAAFAASAEKLSVLGSSSDLAYLFASLPCEFHAMEQASGDVATEFAKMIQQFEPRILVFARKCSSSNPKAMRRLRCAVCGN